MKSVAIWMVVVFVPMLAAGQAVRTAEVRAANIRDLNVRDLGAVGDGKTKDTAAFQKGLDSLGGSGGELVVPAGEYLIGSIELKSNTTLRLQKGAALRGTDDLDDYPIIKARWEGVWVDAHRGLIFASHAEHVAIAGPGKIVGNPKLGGREMPRRPCVIEMINCSDIVLEDFSAEQTRMWTIHPTFCENIAARRLTLRSKTGNGDGIDLDSCRNAIIDRCDIDTGDDCVALKSGRGLEAYREAAPTSDVTISRCRLGDSIFACVGVGSETAGGVRNVRIENSVFTHSGTYSIYIKSHIGRGAFVENITGSGLNVLSATRGFLRINLVTSGRADLPPVPGDEGIPTGRNFDFSDVHLANCGSVVEAVEISPKKPLVGLQLSDISGMANKGLTLANIKDAVLLGIGVTVKRGALIAATDVTGSGLEGAVPLAPVAGEAGTRGSAGSDAGRN